jgi:HD-GYP domain-containing protein (c-di-GMP phosphodiesterase class II)
MDENKGRDIELNHPGQSVSSPPADSIPATASVSSDALYSADMNDLLNSCVSDIRIIVKSDAVMIYIYDADAMLFSIQAHIGITDKFVKELQTIEISESEYKKILRWDSKTSLLEEVLTENTYSKIMKTILRDDINMFIVQPLLLENSLLGMIYIGYHSPRKISTEDNRLLEFISHQTSASIDNIILKKDIIKINKRLELMGAMTMLTGSSVNLNQVFETIAYGIKQLLDLDHVSIAIIDDNIVTFAAAYSSMKSEIVPGYKLTQGATPVSWLKKNNKLYVQNNLIKEMAFSTDGIYTKEGMQSVIYIPLYSHGAIFGYLTVASRNRNAFSNMDQSILQEISVQIANRMEFHRMYTELKQHKEDLESANKQLADKVALLEKNKSLLDSSFLDIAKTVVLLAESREQYTIGHSDRVTDLCKKISLELNLSEDKIRQLESAARLLGLGKANVPEDILNKPGPLNDEEKAKLQSHQMKSLELLRVPDSLSGVVVILENKRENFDGSGYPKKLKGKDIPVESRILAVADAYIAMISDRPYRHAMSSEEAVKTLRGQAGKQWDPLIVIALLHVLK